VPAVLLELRELSVSFPGLGKLLPAVRDVSFSIERGEVLGLVGESGSGKSVTALAIMRLLVPQARATGEILFEGRNLLGATEVEMRRVRGAQITMIFQEPMTALNPVMRVGDQIAEAVLAHAGGSNNLSGDKAPSVSKKEAWAQALEAMKVVSLPDYERRARDYPHQLSGGMRQRVMIAMAIVNRPQLLIGDEPTTALDVTIQAQILELLQELQQKFGLAMLFISHDLAVVSGLASRVAVMYGGSVVEIGAAGEIFHSPMHPYTHGLIAAVPTLDSRRDRPLQAIEGTVPAAAAMPPGCAFEPRCDLRVQVCAQSLPPLVEVGGGGGHLARCPVVAEALPSHRG